MIVVFLVDYIWFSIHNFIDENGSNNSATSYLIFIFFHLLYLGTFFYFSLISTYVVLLTMFFFFLSFYFWTLVLCVVKPLQNVEAEKDQLTELKLNSHILQVIIITNSLHFIWLMNLINNVIIITSQESITKQINENPVAGWEAAINPRFSNYTVTLQLSQTYYFNLRK
jgi:hypothetical protein